MLIAVINESTQVQNNDVNLMCQAIQIQLDLHVLPAWNLKTGNIKFYSDKLQVPGYAWLVSILDSPTVAGALGYHSEDNDLIDGFIFTQPVLSNKGVILYDSSNPQNVSVASVLSHEIIEMIGDRFANLWADGPTIQTTNGPASEYAVELCDPVENDSYAITVAGNLVSISNFIFPSWFNSEAKIPQNLPFDYLKKLTAPFTMSAGGYIIVRQPGNENQVQGRTITPIFGKKIPTWKQELVKSEWYRR